jgi:hypothetical protein
VIIIAGVALITFGKGKTLATANIEKKCEENLLSQENGEPVEAGSS